MLRQVICSQRNSRYIGVNTDIFGSGYFSATSAAEEIGRALIRAFSLAISQSMLHSSGADWPGMQGRYTKLHVPAHQVHWKKRELSNRKQQNKTAFARIP